MPFTSWVLGQLLVQIKWKRNGKLHCSMDHEQLKDLFKLGGCWRSHKNRSQEKCNHYPPSMWKNAVTKIEWSVVTFQRVREGLPCHTLEIMTQRSDVSSNTTSGNEVTVILVVLWSLIEDDIVCFDWQRKFRLFVHKTVTRVEEKDLYGLRNLFAEIGGFVGIFLGYSLLDVVNIVIPMIKQLQFKVSK